MEIERIWFHQLPKGRQLEGNIVMVDANAASSNLSVLLSKNPNHLIVVNEESLARARSTYSGSILVGESLSLPEEQFLASNHISDIARVEVEGRNILWMSNNGSRVLERAVKSCQGQVLAGGFNNCLALTNFLINDSKPVYIIMSGNQGDEVLEDRICGEVIEKRLKGETFDWNAQKEQVVQFIMEYYAGQRQIKDDLPYLLHLDQFGIVPKCFINDSGFLEVKNHVSK